MIEKTLEEQLEEAKRKEGWFCPQINGMCNYKCYCYIPPQIVTVKYNDGTEKRRLQEAWCTHALHQEQLEVNAIIQR